MIRPQKPSASCASRTGPTRRGRWQRAGARRGVASSAVLHQPLADGVRGRVEEQNVAGPSPFEVACPDQQPASTPLGGWARKIRVSGSHVLDVLGRLDEAELRLSYIAGAVISKRRPQPSGLPETTASCAAGRGRPSLRTNSLIHLRLRILLLPQCFQTPVPNISAKSATPPSL